MRGSVARQRRAAARNKVKAIYARDSIMTRHAIRLALKFRWLRGVMRMAVGRARHAETRSAAFMRRSARFYRRRAFALLLTRQRRARNASNPRGI